MALVSLPARAGDPAGEWRVEDGQAHIRIGLCAGRLWGIVSWEQTPGADENNPDPALRGRATLGLPIVLGMAPTSPDRWEGPVYNPENGKTYQATIRLKGANTLEVEGCIMYGWVCSSENWTRMRPGLVGSARDRDLCLRIGAGAGLPPERGVK